MVAVTWQDAQARKLNALSFLVMAFLALFNNIFEAINLLLIIFLYHSATWQWQYRLLSRT